MTVEHRVRSFLFCTSFVRDATGERSFERWRRWASYYWPRRGLFGADRLFLVDDGSARGLLPPDLPVLAADEPLPDRLPEGPVMLRFEEHYGRSSLAVFPGWWRSFTFASQIAERYGYAKIVHCESDAYVLSRRMAVHMASLDEGWTAYWCPLFGIPESSLQVICGDAVARLERLYHEGARLWFQGDRVARLGAQVRRLARGRRLAREAAGVLLAALMPQSAEFVLPFDVVDKGFVGDRYGERDGRCPAEADYVCQTTLAMPLVPEIEQVDG